MQFVRIEPGRFRMGSTPEQIKQIVEIWDAEQSLMLDELPAHEVRITRPFEMSVTEVTQKQYYQIMGENPSLKEGDNLPVNHVVYDNATEFCRRLSERTGRRHRLPTEAEWEYACRAGSDGQWCFGDDDTLLEQYGWFDESPKLGLQPVGQLKPNAWGLYDMHGNVWELCADLYEAKYYESSLAVDPRGPKQGPGRIVRGGSAFDIGHKTRAAERDFAKPFGQVNLGFRVVRELESLPAGDR